MKKEEQKTTETDIYTSALIFNGQSQNPDKVRVHIYFDSAIRKLYKPTQGLTFKSDGEYFSYISTTFADSFEKD